MQELLVIENLNPVDVFKSGGIGPILAMIEAEVSAEVPDTSTAKGRKAIASNAYKVSQSKTLLDKMGKKLTDDLNARLKPINAERKIARDSLDELKDVIRQPLTDWELDQENIKLLAEARAAAEALAVQVEFSHEVALLVDAEFDRQRVAQIEAEKKAKAEYEEQLKSEAAAQAKLEAETAAKALIDKAEADKLAAEQAAAEQVTRAKVAAERAESDRLTALAKAEYDLKAAAKLNEQERQAAIASEQARQAAEIEEERVETQKREKNRAHVGSIRKAVKEGLMLIDGVDEELAKLIVLALSNGVVAHAKITY